MTDITITLSPRAVLLTAVAVAAFLVLCAVLFVRHQRLLKDRAHFMREAMHNREFTFRLPAKGLLPGERALQEALNDLGADISRMVAENEVESWRRLIRVLTHEIMNATAPICSISRAYLDFPSVKGTPLEEGLRAIHDTGNALTAFTGSFRKLTQLQPPVPERVSLSDFAAKLRALFPSMQWHTDIPASASVTADEGMLLQVMANLARNASEAGASAMSLQWDGPRLLVSNNGEPIPPAVLRNIFVPFFTTKPSGSGIGLALSRQLMVSQGGNLSLTDKPQPGWSVTFAVTFPAL